MSRKGGVGPHEWTHWTIDSYNSAHLGMTQTGKTVAARELHKESPRLSVWLNESGDDRVPDVASEGQPVRSLDGFRSALQRDQWKINWVSSDRERDIQSLRKELWRIAERADRRFPMQVVVDEIDRLAPETNKNDHTGLNEVLRFASEGVKRNIKFVGITQDPRSASKKWLRQSEYRVVWRMSNENQSAVSEFGFDWDSVEKGPRYSGAVHEATGDVIDDDVQAKETYA